MGGTMQIDLKVIQEVLGDKELQIIALRSEVITLQKRIAELESKKETKDGNDSKSH